MRALLMVDLDYANAFTPGIIRINSKKGEFVSRVVDLLEEFRHNNEPIIFVTYGKGNGYQIKPKGRYCIACGWHGWRRNLSDLFGHLHEGSEPIFCKEEMNAFTNPYLARYLRSMGVEELLLAGSAKFACILDTAQGALFENFKVQLLEDYVWPRFSDGFEVDKWMSRASLGGNISPKLSVAKALSF